MAIDKVTRNFCLVRGRSLRSSLVILAIVVTGALSAVVLHGNPANGATTFVQPIQASDTLRDDAHAAPASIVTTLGGQRRAYAEWTDDPRECDLEKGIFIACIFMD